MIRRAIVVSVIALTIVGATFAQEWRTSTPEAQGMDSEVLAKAIESARRARIPIHSFLVARNGFIVLDASFYPYSGADMHDAASVTKSITATLIGIAIGKHLLTKEQPVLSFFPDRDVRNVDDRKRRMTVEHLLTMQSGLDCHLDHAEITLRQMQGSKDWIQFMLDLPMTSEPGTKFAYCSGGMHLLSGIVSKVMGMSALEFAKRELFAPLGITDVIWPSDPNGVSRGWGDLHLRPRDMAKIGELWRNGGRWGDKQIIPEEFLDAASQPHAHPNFGSGEYGYGFWVYPKRTPPEFEALGRGGQRINVNRGNRNVVVFTGGEFEPGDVGKFIGESMKSDGPLAANPAGVAHLAAALRAAAQPPVVPPAPVARSISRKTFVVDDNPLGWKSFSLTFAGNEAALHIEKKDGHVEQRAIGIDGAARISRDGRYGLPVALRGWWEANDAFVLEYDEVANINCYVFRLTFGSEGVAIEVDEKTGLLHAGFRGRS